MIDHKNVDITAPQMSAVHPELGKILGLASFLAYEWYGDDLVITAIYDPNHPGLTHRALEKYHRFVDCRLLSRGGLVGSERLRRTINAAYQYDPQRPMMETIPLLDHGTGPHFHFQLTPAWLSWPEQPRHWT